MFDHVTIRVADLAASRRFYDTVFAAIGKDRATGEELVEWGDWSIHQATAGDPPTQGLHVAFHVPTAELVEAFWQAGVDAGYEDDGRPGPRPHYGDDYVGGFLRDPDGNSVEAVRKGIPRDHGQIDHLWLRVADVAAARAFYATVAPHVGLTVGIDRPDWVQFRHARGSFSLVTDGRPRTERVHLAFAVPGPDAVRAFHAAATRAGYQDNGAPGERPQYHPGYHGAFVLDPDGHNVEAVHHGRPQTA